MGSMYGLVCLHICDSEVVVRCCLLFLSLYNRGRVSLTPRDDRFGESS